MSHTLSAEQILFKRQRKVSEFFCQNKSLSSVEQVLQIFTVEQTGFEVKAIKKKISGDD